MVDGMYGLPYYGSLTKPHVTVYGYSGLTAIVSTSHFGTGMSLESPLEVNPAVAAALKVFDCGVARIEHNAEYRDVPSVQLFYLKLSESNGISESISGL